MRIEELSSTLHRNEDGIYVSGRQSTVSYATEGHAECFGVEDGSFWFRHRNRCIKHMVANHPFSDGPFLDIGGGNGYVAQGLTAEGYDVVLIEPGPIGARNARVNRKLDHVVCATVEDAGFELGAFGAIGMFDVIEHIEQDRAFIEHIAPLLAPSGRLYLTVPCHQWLWSGADVEAGHFRRHTQSSLQSLLKDLFRIDYLTYFFRPLVLPQLLLRAIPYRLGVGRDRVISTESEHGSKNGIAVRAINHLLNRESETIAAGRTISFGSSCLVAASRL